MVADSQEPGNSVADSSSSAPELLSRKKPRHASRQSQEGKLWEEFGNPEEPINLLPGGTYNSAGGKPKEVTVMDAFKSLSMSDFTSFYKAPCARDSLLFGIGTGFGVGSIRGILGGFHSLSPACNWAVGAFAIASFAAHEFCQRRRVNELEGMKEAVRFMNDLKIKKQKERELASKAREEAARGAEQEQKRRSWINVANYKFW